jgi:hypothetical protein
VLSILLTCVAKLQKALPFILEHVICFLPFILQNFRVCKIRVVGTNQRNFKYVACDLLIYKMYLDFGRQMYRVLCLGKCGKPLHNLCGNYLNFLFLLPTNNESEGGTCLALDLPWTH